MNLTDLIPEHVHDWRASGPDGRYDRETIFKYMDGAAEVYLSFSFRELLVRNLAKPGAPELTVELYDMGTAADAYGIYSRNRQGTSVGIGQGSEYRSGYLFFWKGRYFAAVFAAQETDDSKAAVLGLAGSIAERIEEEGAIPDIVSLLPEEDRSDTFVRYFHRHTDLNQHYFISDDNVLGLDARTEAALTRYETGGDPTYLLVVRYPTAAKAGAALGEFTRRYVRDAGASRVTRLRDGTWCAIDIEDSYLIAVLGGPTSDHAERLLKATADRVRTASMDAGEDPQ